MCSSNHPHWAHKNAAQSILDLFSHLALACKDADSKLFAGDCETVIKLDAWF